LAFYCKINPEF